MTTLPTSHTTSPHVSAGPPSIPLTDEVRAAYRDLLDKLQAAIENTTDVGVLEILNAARSEVDQTLTKDGKYRLGKNTALFEELLDQIKSTNADLQVLKTQILAIDNYFEEASVVLAAVDKVIGLVPGF